MSTNDESETRGLLSALSDGEVDAAQGARGCEAWSEPAGRQTWRDYHLIGDVLRSQELASSDEHDAAFLARLRSRLADEDRVATPASGVPRRHWRLPLALAAGVAALASALSLSTWLEGAAPAGRMAAAPVSATPAEAATSVVIRDAQLDRYLRAHRDYGAAQPVSLPGAAARRVETVSFQR